VKPFELRRSEAGAATVLVVASAGVLFLVLGALLTVGLIGIAQRKAATAADLTALAAASDGPSCARASALARANGARLLGCLPGPVEDVTVRVVVDLRLPLPAGSTPLVAVARAGRITVPVSARADAP
jgi:secretion/DNA translocation related TadE-like protein